MYGHGSNNNKLKIHPGFSPGFFRGVPALRAFPGVMTVAGGTGQGEQGRGKAIFHALFGNCKENIAKARLKTEISRKTRKFLPKNLHKAKICRTFAMSKRKTNKSNETF